MNMRTDCLSCRTKAEAQRPRGTESNRFLAFLSAPLRLCVEGSRTGSGDPIFKGQQDNTKRTKLAEIEKIEAS
jgi:hypothetical protein